jgi:hypothetical protein
MFPGETNANDDVSGAGAARDDRRTTVYPCVMNGAGSIVAWLGWAEGLTPKRISEFLRDGFRKHNDLLRDAGRREHTPPAMVIS